MKLDLSSLDGIENTFYKQKIPKSNFSPPKIILKSRKAIFQPPLGEGSRLRRECFKSSFFVVLCTTKAGAFAEPLDEFRTHLQTENPCQQLFFRQNNFEITKSKISTPSAKFRTPQKSCKRQLQDCGGLRKVENRVFLFAKPERKFFYALFCFKKDVFYIWKEYFFSPFLKTFLLCPKDNPGL